MKRFWKSTDTPHFENSHAPPPFPRVCARIVRTAAFNALLIIAGLAVIAVAGEMYFRVSVPYGFDANPKDFGYHTWKGRFVQNVGNVTAPNQEIRYSNHLDFWTITQVNSLGFLDREPVSPERASESCHIALIGDSFVVGKEVPIADKAQVKLEELAARELPHLDVTTSAFGRGSFGQINQLAFYDEYARHLRPKVVALVFVPNDFPDNSTILTALEHGLDPDHMPRVTAAIGANGTPDLRPPDPDYLAFRMAPPFKQAQTSDNDEVKPYTAAFASVVGSAKTEAVNYSYFAKWLDVKYVPVARNKTRRPKLVWQADLLSQRPRYSTLLQEWTPTTYRNLSEIFSESDLPPVFEEALAYTKFGLEQFKRRADRDDAKLVILSTHIMKTFGIQRFERLTAMTKELDIPVIDQHDYIISAGAVSTDAKFKHDWHWNKDGHRWAAEALLEWLKDNQEVCD